MGIVLGAIGVIPLLKGKELNLYLIGIAAAFSIVGFLKPEILSPIYKIWMRVGEVLGRINSFVILSVIFYLVLTPLGILIRLFTTTPNKFKFKYNSDTHWIKRDAVDVKKDMKRMF